jgi:chromate transport protein ChrA
METIFAYILALLIAHNYRYFAYSKFNTSINTYKTARKILFSIFFGVFLLLFLAPSGVLENSVVVGRRGLSGSPEFVLFGTIYAAVILMLDQNYRFSRRQGYESNFLKHSMVQFCICMPFLLCFLASKLTIGYLIIIAVFGGFIFGNKNKTA